ncbi:hypothetical protein J6590_035896 [Homalodisca vitripennis]|nr:hypothetical protein J6590_035896 [Homalodisca vitripennis]
MTETPEFKFMVDWFGSSSQVGDGRLRSAGPDLAGDAAVISVYLTSVWNAWPHAIDRICRPAGVRASPLRLGRPKLGRDLDLLRLRTKYKPYSKICRTLGALISFIFRGAAWWLHQ